MDGNKKQKFYTAAYTLFLFGALFWFFFFAHPQIPFDFDDWGNLPVLRLPLPLPNYWNPSRIFPETFYPLSGFAAALVCKCFPAISLVRAESLVTGLFLSALVTVYAICFEQLLERKLFVKRSSSMLFSLIFILLHFAALRSEETGNLHFFMSTNLSCCYYYLMPAIINCSFIMHLMAFKPERLSLKLLLVIYFTVFSNQFASIILASYCGCELLLSFIKAIKEKTVRDFPAKNKVFIVIFALWIVSVAADAFGGRGRNASGGENAFSALLSLELPDAGEIMARINPAIGLSAAILIAGFVIFAFKKLSAEEKSFLGSSLFAGATASVMLVLLCAEVSPLYINRTEVFFGIAFFAFMLTVCCLAKLGCRLKWGDGAAVLAAAALLLAANTKGTTFADSYCEQIDSQTCRAISECIISQITDACEAGEEEVIVHVPKSYQDLDDNWPFNYRLNSPLSELLYRLRITDREMKIEILPDEALNEKFGVDF